MERTKEALQVLESKVTGKSAPERQTKADYIEEIAKAFNPGGSAAQQFAHIFINDSYAAGYTLTLDDHTVATYDDLVNYLIGKGIFVDCNNSTITPDLINIPVYSAVGTGFQYSAQLDSPCIGFSVLKNFQYPDPEDPSEPVSLKTGNVLVITDGASFTYLLKENIGTFEVTYLGQ